MRPRFRLEERPPGSLVPNPANFRRHPDAQKLALQASIDEHGWLAAPLLNERTGHLLDGHARVDMALADGEATLPVSIIDVSPAQERRILRSLDRITEMAEIDTGALDALIESIDDAALEQLLAEVASSPSGLLLEADPDALPEDVETRCKPGDLWQLGEHRLLCGDSTKAEDAQRLMIGKRASLMATDPPYNIGFNFEGEYHGQDRKEPEEYRFWLRSITDLGEDYLESGSPVFIWQNMLNLRYFEAWFGDRDWRLFAALKNFVQTRPTWLQYSWDPVVVWTKGARAVHSPAGIRDYHLAETSITRSTPDRRLTGQHPCPRPLDTVAWIIESHTAPDAVVYDPFAGSGTTIIACEQTGRVAHCIEIEPRYVDVCLARWEQATGKTAEKI